MQQDKLWMEPSETMNPDEHLCFPIDSLGYFISYGKLFNTFAGTERELICGE